MRHKHKYSAIRTELDGIKFDSKLEASYYKHLKLLQALGEVVFFLRQTPLHLPSGVKLVLDFQVFYTNGDIDFVDVKGMETLLFKSKKRIAEATYPITINVVKKGAF